MGLYNGDTMRNAWDANKDEEGNLYHHPTQKGIFKKCIDLFCRKPLHDIKHEPSSNGSERWLEAYIIRLAKQHNKYQNPFELPGVNERYRFLDSQRNFESDVNGPPRNLDCLLFQQENRSLVVIELKANGRERAKAITELDHYTKKISKIKDEISSVFNLGGVSAIEGYIVWPGDDIYQKEKLTFETGG